MNDHRDRITVITDSPSSTSESWPSPRSCVVAVTELLATAAPTSSQIPLSRPRHHHHRSRRGRATINTDFLITAAPLSIVIDFLFVATAPPSVRPYHLLQKV
ncbi:rootletin [Sesbania bispinosa]|nr:rootletin [Sesbania bispinosa]